MGRTAAGGTVFTREKTDDSKTVIRYSVRVNFSPFLNFGAAALSYCDRFLYMEDRGYLELRALPLNPNQKLVPTRLYTICQIYSSSPPQRPINVPSYSPITHVILSPMTSHLSLDKIKNLQLRSRSLTLLRSRSRLSSLSLRRFRS